MDDPSPIPTPVTKTHSLANGGYRGIPNQACRQTSIFSISFILIYADILGKRSPTIGEEDVTRHITRST
jgi:hypothetical protein